MFLASQPKKVANPEYCQAQTLLMLFANTTLIKLEIISSILDILSDEHF